MYDCLPCSQCSFPQCVTSDVERENRDCLFGKHLNTGSAAPGILLKFRHLTIEHWSIVPLRDVSYYFWATYKLDIEGTNAMSVDLFPSHCFCRMDIFVLTYFFHIFVLRPLCGCLRWKTCKITISPRFSLVFNFVLFLLSLSMSYCYCYRAAKKMFEMKNSCNQPNLPPLLAIKAKEFTQQEAPSF